LHPIARRFKDIADYCPFVAVDRGVPLFNTVLRRWGEGVNAYIQDCEIWHQETRDIVLC